MAARAVVVTVPTMALEEGWPLRLELMRGTRAARASAPTSSAEPDQTSAPVEADTPVPDMLNDEPSFAFTD
jgi:hypothetical protein